MADGAEYIEEKVGAGFVILDTMTPLFPKSIPKSEQPSFKNVHPALGSLTEFNTVLRSLKKRGMQTVITLNFNSIPVNHELATAEYLKRSTSNDKVGFESITHVASSV